MLLTSPHLSNFADIIYTTGMKWYESTVISGSKIGRTLGFPTANLDTAILSDVEKEGVYASDVEIDGVRHLGALYLGPRLILDETVRVLEIFLLDFNGDLYNKPLSFRLGQYIRGPQDFDSFDELIVQLEKDVAAIRLAAEK